MDGVKGKKLTKRQEISEVIDSLPDGKRALAKDMLDELTFMFATLKKLRAEVRRDGPIVDFVQGKQIVKVQNPALKAYNDIMPKYNTLTKTLLGCVSEAVAEFDDGPSELEKFLMECGEKKEAGE